MNILIEVVLLSTILFSTVVFYNDPSIIPMEHYIQYLTLAQFSCLLRVFFNLLPVFCLSCRVASHDHFGTLAFLEVMQSFILYVEAKDISIMEYLAAYHIPIDLSPDMEYHVMHVSMTLGYMALMYVGYCTQPILKDVTKQELITFLQHYQPEKLEDVDALLEKYAGREELMFTLLYAKYTQDEDEENEEDDGEEKETPYWTPTRHKSSKLQQAREEAAAAQQGRVDERVATLGKKNQ